MENHRALCVLWFILLLMLDLYRPERSFEDRRGRRFDKKRPEDTVNHLRMALMGGMKQFGRLLAIFRAVPHADRAARQFF